MPGSTGPHIGLVWGYSPGEVGWGVGGFNPNFAKLEMLTQLSVLSILATPPGSPANGDSYIVGASPTGDWAGHTNAVAVWYTIGTPAWLFMPPARGHRAYNAGTSTYWRYTGSAWVEETPVSGPASAVNGRLALFDGTTGRLLDDSGIDAADVLLSGGDLGTPASGDATNLVNIPVDEAIGVLGETHGGVGTVNGIVKADGAGNTSAAVAGVDYALPGVGSSVTVSDTAPIGPSVGDLWWDSSGGSGQLYLYYDPYWVAATSIPGAVGPAGPAGPSWTVGSGLSLDTGTSPATISLTTPALPLAGGTLTGSLTVDSAAQVTLAASAGDYTVLKAPTAGGNITLGGTSAVYNYYINTNHTFRNLSALDTMVLDGAGNLLIAGSDAYKTGGGSWIAPSDPILKREISEYKSGLAQVLALVPIEYKYNGKGGFPDDGRSYVGLDARATEPVMPELVGSMMIVLDPVRDATVPSGEVPDTEIKTIDTSPLIFALLNAVKELSARIVALEEAK